MQDGPAKPWVLEPPLTLFSPRGSLVLASHPQLPGLPISTPRSTSHRAPTNLLLTLLVNIRPSSQTRNLQPSYRLPSGTQVSTYSISPTTFPTLHNRGSHSLLPSQQSPRNSVQYLLFKLLAPRPLTDQPSPQPNGSS